MRHIAILIIATLISTIANAKCKGNGIYFPSNNRLLNRNGLLILEFHGSSQSIILDLNKKYPIFLKSKQGKVSLSVIEVQKGEFGITEVILKPCSLLNGNENYYFNIDNLPKYEGIPNDYNPNKHKDASVIFKTTNFIDNELPLLKDIPVETKKDLTYFGCGPSISVSFKIKAEDKSKLFVRASVKNEKTGTTTDYILKMENGEVSIGHGMCSGAFNLEEGGYYEVSFCLIDQSGNKTSFTKPIRFTAPKAPTKGE